MLLGRQNEVSIPDRVSPNSTVVVARIRNLHAEHFADDEMFGLHGTAIFPPGILPVTDDVCWDIVFRSNDRVRDRNTYRCCHVLATQADMVLVDR